MAKYHTAREQRTLIGKLGHGDDLLAALGAVAGDEGVRLGTVTALGAVKKARLGYYDQGTRTYEYFALERALEITALVGNVSLKEGAPIVHAHVTLADAEGRAFGGHLAPGTEVFACEFVMRVLEGPELTRGHDEQTGLPLWEM